VLKRLKPLKTNEQQPQIPEKIGGAGSPPPAAGTGGWQQLSSKLLGHLSSAAQTALPQMPGAVQAQHTPRKND